MKIAWLSHRDIRNRLAGGAEQTTFEVASRLLLAGHEVVWYSLGSPELPANDALGSIRIHRYPNPAVLHSQPFSRRFSAEKYNLVVEDLAHVVPFGLGLLRKYPCIAYFRHLHRRTVFGQVGPVSAGILCLIERSYPFTYPRATIVTESRAASADLVSMGIDDQFINRIPPGVDLDLFAPRADYDGRSLIYFGGLKRYKRPGHVIYLLAGLHALGIPARLTVVGEGPELDRMRALTRSLGVASFVTFSGRMSRGELPKIIASAALNIHTSRSEGWGLSALEAAACGVPTVAYSVPGLEDSVMEQVSGLLVQDNSLRALINAAAEVLKNPDGWRIRTRGWASNFAWDNCASAWSSLISRVALAKPVSNS